MVKQLLCHAPVLFPPDFTRPFKLEVDASAVGAGAALMQGDSDGVDHPFSYFWCKFNTYQGKYSTIVVEHFDSFFFCVHWFLQPATCGLHGPQRIRGGTSRHKGIYGPNKKNICSYLPFPRKPPLPNLPPPLKKRPFPRNSPPFAPPTSFTPQYTHLNYSLHTPKKLPLPCNSPNLDPVCFLSFPNEANIDLIEL